MFGKILNIVEDTIEIENTSNETESNLLGFHVIFNVNERKIVGEIVGVLKNVIRINLLGEIINDEYVEGLIKKPSLKSGCRLIYKSEVAALIGNQDITAKNSLFVGKSMIYDNFNVTANLNEFMSGHFAIVGNTGSGKSCGTARLIQNMFYYNNEHEPTNAHIAIFDVYGEYNNAFSKLDKINNIHFRNYTTKLKGVDNLKNIIRFPAYFLGVDDIALLLNATEADQLQIIQKTLELVYLFKSEDKETLAYKNYIISTALLDILTSGKNTTQIRDQIIAVLTKYNTISLSLDTQIIQPGYVRTFKQCLNIDNQGKMNSIQLVIELLEKFIHQELSPYKKDKMIVYSLEDIYYAFEFALISEGVLKSDRVFDKNNILKVRLSNIINSGIGEYFKYEELISKFDYTKKLFCTELGENVQVININFNDIDERFAKVLTKIYSKLFFNVATELVGRATYPIHIILEEAHRYVQHDSDIDVIGYNIFDRITKEGRKYGVLLGLITQRPSELSVTALSQCSNFIAFRMYHPDDVDLIKSITSHLSPEKIEKLRSLRPGTAICFGTAFPIPTMTIFELPDPMPISRSVDINNVWFN